MRLIDADDFKERYCKENCGGRKCVDDFDKCILISSFIPEQPTAYDVDEVVEQLKEEQEKLDTDIFARESDNWYGQYCNGISDGIEKAIDIVKGGGIDG